MFAKLLFGITLLSGLFIRDKHIMCSYTVFRIYRGADKSLTQPTSRCILFDGENISFDASLVIYI